MLIYLKTQYISLTVDTLGAQMMSLTAGDAEYLWQGDPAYWTGRAPTLFPFIGRLWDNRYSFRGNIYKMGIHGFAAKTEFTPTQQGPDFVVLSLRANENTEAVYPFQFAFNVTYRLVERSVRITYSICNEGEDIMPFGIGGHPGFRVPIGEGEQFEDYCLEFSSPCQPDRVGFTPAVYLSGMDAPYSLEDGKRIWLKHDLFDDDAIILKNMSREITLKSRKHFVRVSYPQMGYLGLWHWPKTDAPYVCIEPWTSLPARQDVVEDLACKSDLIHLLPGKTHENTWTITIGRNES